tara:strand:- start:173 stop:343 length:171 start_codon:yes stop_codon:yes gene_type:complete
MENLSPRRLEAGSSEQPLTSNAATDANERESKMRVAEQIARLKAEGDTVRIARTLY